MKNVLIPTSYNEDTIYAIEKALLIGGSDPFEIILLSVASMPDSIMDFLVSNARREMPDALRSQLKEYEENRFVVIREHHQYGASHTLLEQVAHKFEVGLIVIPHSFQHSKEIIEQEALAALRKMKLRTVLAPQTIVKERFDYKKDFTESEIG